MIRSFLLGAVAGMRSMTPLAAVVSRARRTALAGSGRLDAFLADDIVYGGAMALAAGELLGDKLPSAPDRIAAPGLAARLVTGALCGAALAPRRERPAAAVLGAVGAVGGAYLSFALRTRAIDRFGQVPTGLLEDAITIAATQRLVNGSGLATPDHHSMREPS